MAKFRFRFSTVLDVRKQREQDAMIALGDAQRVYQQGIECKHGLQQELQAALIRREGLTGQATSVHIFQLEQNFINGTKQRIIRAEQALVRASRNVEKALKAYLATRKETRMIETLEEKDRLDFKAEQAKKERKEMDEMVILRSRLREESA